MKKQYAKPSLTKCGTLSLVTAFSVSSDDGDNGGTASDIRLKTNIEQVGVASNGLPLYQFRYFWSDVVYRGVMAQDVLKVFPEAVQTMPNGFMAVNYGALGMEMTRVH
ncbi:MAG: tail fiber domain-containing protein [Rhizobiaceae bacterium]|nr:tail fiber domain-containing protein [Rhizobiaceae bacterium]